jgi:hypothetical protein
MAEIVMVSLRQRLQQKAVMLLTVACVLMSMTILYFVTASHQSFIEKSLTLKHRAAKEVFNNYLDRAEDEMKLISQDLSLSDYVSGRELDFLFSHRDALFFGELDFFYIEWVNGQQAMDPRARLFTQAKFEPLLREGLINKWVSVLAEDGSILLMYKKKILSDTRKNVGFLYGFISLNENLTLSSDLLDSAQVLAVRIYDQTNDRLLLQEYKSGVDLTGPILRSSSPLVSSVHANLELDISQQEKPFFDVVVSALPFIVVADCVLLLFYFLLMHQIKKYVFVPIETIAYQNDESLLPYREFQPIQLRTSLDKAFIESKEHRFKLLTESIHCAIIFCNEVTEIEMINAEAKKLFPDSIKARTIFDFMPISCHQNIQEALKGEVGITFDLTFDNQGWLYKWHAHSFVNETGYQGVLLVGRNITKEISLIWQLEQLQPLSVAAQKKVDTDAILSELTYLSRLPHHITAAQLRGWTSLLISVLDDIGGVDTDVSYLPIGDVLAQESAYVMETMGIEANRALLDCPLEVGVKVVVVSTNFRSLIRVLFMMVMSNDMEERRLSIKYVRSEFECIAMHDMASRPLFFWMIKVLLDSLGGEQKALRNNVLQLNFMLEKGESRKEFRPLRSNQVVAWISNDYPNAISIQEALLRLGLNVEKYDSTDSFLTRSSDAVKFDIILIGCDRAFASQLNMTESLKLKYNRNQLPIVWLNSTFPDYVAPDVFTLLGCPSDYSLYQVLLKANELDGIMPIQSNGKALSWIIVGGSRVAKAIWNSELELYDIEIQWLADLSNYSLVLSYHMDASIVLLAPQSKALLETIQNEFPQVRFFSVQSGSEMPDNVAIFEIKQPYVGEQIRSFTDYVMQKS